MDQDVDKDEGNRIKVEILTVGFNGVPYRQHFVEEVYALHQVGNRRLVQHEAHTCTEICDRVLKVE